MDGMTPATQVIQEIERALEAGPTSGPWRELHTRIDDANGYQLCHLDLHGKSEKERDANRRLIAASHPDNIRTLLARIQELEKDATKARREALLDFYSSLTNRAANNYHGRPSANALCQANNKLICEWADKALDELLATTEVQYECKPEWVAKFMERSVRYNKIFAPDESSVDAAIAQSKKPEGV